MLLLSTPSLLVIAFDAVTWRYTRITRRPNILRLIDYAQKRIGFIFFIFLSSYQRGEKEIYEKDGHPRRVRDGHSIFYTERS